MKVKVAAVQSSPVFFNLEATLEKTEVLAKNAKQQGADLIVFPETWLPGYPAFLDYCPGVCLWDDPAMKKVFARLRKNSVEVPSSVTERLSNIARENEVVINISVHEKVTSGSGNGTLYNTMLTFDETGSLKNVHRKLVPTYTEKLLWGMGDGGGLESAQTKKAGRVGGLICWEHWMPLARQAMHQSGEDIHVAVWPTVHEDHQLASRHYAFEGRCFVVASGCLLQVKDLPEEFEILDEYKDKPDAYILHGGSAIIGPDGKYLAEPVFEKEAIITAECYLSRRDEELMTLDVTGHYNRPDIYEFKVKKLS